MPKEPELTQNNWDALVDLIQEGAAKSYICRLFNITPAQLKKAKKRLGLTKSKLPRR